MLLTRREQAKFKSNLSEHNVAAKSLNDSCGSFEQDNILPAKVDPDAQSQAKTIQREMEGKNLQMLL